MLRFIVSLIPLNLSVQNLSAQAKNRPGEESQPASVVAFRHVNLVPMTSETVVPGQTVIVEGKLIAGIGPDAEMAIPVGATIIEGGGHYLMPGLADMHAHYHGDYERDAFFNFFLKNGITTVRLLQSFPTDVIMIWQDEIRHGRLFGPNLFSCGLLFDDPVIPPETMLTTRRNYDFVKLYSYLSASEFTATMRLAKQEKIYTIGHVPFLVGLDGVTAAGMNEVAHITELDFDLVDYPRDESLRNQLMGVAYTYWVRDFYSSPGPQAYLGSVDERLDSIVSKVKNAGMFVNTTLIVTHLMVEQLFEKEKFIQRPELKYMLKGFMPEYLAGNNCYQRMMGSLMEANEDLIGGDDGRTFLDTYLEINRRLTKKLHDAGVLLLLGTDTPTLNAVPVVPGYSFHEELQLLCGCGLSPYETIKTATVNAGIAAQAMTGTNPIGTIEVGKQADFVLTAKNPLQDVANIQEMIGVMVQGRWLSKDALDGLKIGVRTGLSDALEEVVSAEGDAAAILERYHEIKGAGTDEFSIVAEPLNILGNKLLNAGKIPEAVAVFQINVTEFPEHWGWYDSLAGAYVKAGEKALAVENYEKALELNPDNPKLQEVLQRLKD